VSGYADRCVAIDRTKQKAAGWGNLAWVGVNYAAPRTKAERLALAFLKRRQPDIVSLHAYNLVELLAEVFQEEIDDHSEGRA